MKPTKFLISSIAIVASFATLALAQPSGGVADRFKQRDKNGDGKLDRNELPAALFDRFDVNKDGFVDEEELKALRAGKK